MTIPFGLNTTATSLQPSRSSILGPAVLSMILSFSATAGPQLFRWIDDKGKVHYGDRVPAKYVQDGFRVISEQGITVFNIGPSSEDETLKPKKKASPLTTYERGLIATYSNEDELRDAKQKKLDDIDTFIQLTQDNIQLQKNRFHQLTKNAGDFERRQTEVPANLKIEISNTRDKITNHSGIVERYLSQRTEEAKRFDDDLKNYRRVRKQIQRREKMRH